MTPRTLHLSLAFVLLLGVSGLPSTHAVARVDGDTERDGVQQQRAQPAWAGAKDSVEADISGSRSRKGDDTPLEEQQSQQGVERSHHGMGYGGYGHGHKLDLYSSLAIFSFAIFLGYILYNYIRSQQAPAPAVGRSLLHPATDDVWSVANSLDLEVGTLLAARVLSSMERWDDVFHTLPRDPSLVDVIGLVTRRLF